MDRHVVNEKLESLRRCVQRIETKCPASPRELIADADLQDILALNLTRAVQLCVDVAAHVLSRLDVPIPGTMGETFDALTVAKVLPAELAARMKRAVGFRNIAVHNYRAIDWEIVHGICRRNLDDFKTFATIVVKLL